MKELMRLKDMQHELGGISARAVYMKVHKKRIPRPLKIGGISYWRRRDWEAWLEREARAQGVAVDPDHDQQESPPPPTTPRRRGPGRPRKEVRP